MKRLSVSDLGRKLAARAVVLVESADRAFFEPVDTEATLNVLRALARA